MGARGVYISPGVREGVLDESKDDEVGLWTQTLLARDELDGWSGLRLCDGLQVKRIGKEVRDKMRRHNQHNEMLLVSLQLPC